MGSFLNTKWISAVIVTITLISSSSGQKKCTKNTHLHPVDKIDSSYKWEPKASQNEAKCLWTVIGDEGCPVKISCDLHSPKVGDDCPDEGLSVKVSDGSVGEKIFCGKTSFTVRPSQDVLRDLYLTIRVPKGYSGKSVSCKAACNPKKDGDPLPTDIERKTEMQCVCGLQNKDDRIVGGEDAMLNEFPWQAAVVFAGTRAPNCGASVINDRFVLTAAHCFWFSKKQPGQIEVLIHAHTLDMTKKKTAKDVQMGRDGSIQSSGYNHSRKTDEDEKTQRFAVLEIINHPLFTEHYDYDVALLRLDGKIKLSDPDAPTPVCLPPPTAYNSLAKIFTDKMMTVVGWGLAAENAGGTTRVLQKLDVPYVTDDTCVGTSPGLITPRMFCAGYMDGTQKDACTGDSGGPLIFKQDNKQFIQTGVVSWGEGCARKGKPGVYAKVTEFMQWIHYHTYEADAKWCQEQK